MKIIIKNDGYKGYMVSNRKKYTDEEIESAIKALKNEMMKLSFNMIISILSNCYMTDEAKVEAIRKVVDTSIELQYEWKTAPNDTFEGGR